MMKEGTVSNVIDSWKKMHLQDFPKRDSTKKMHLQDFGKRDSLQKVQVQVLQQPSKNRPVEIMMNRTVSGTENKLSVGCLAFMYVTVVTNIRLAARDASIISTNNTSIASVSSNDETQYKNSSVFGKVATLRKSLYYPTYAILRKLTHSITYAMGCTTLLTFAWRNKLVRYCIVRQRNKVCRTVGCLPDGGQLSTVGNLAKSCKVGYSTTHGRVPKLGTLPRMTEYPTSSPRCAEVIATFSSPGKTCDDSGDLLVGYSTTNDRVTKLVTLSRLLELLTSMPNGNLAKNHRIVGTGKATTLTDNRLSVTIPRVVLPTLREILATDISRICINISYNVDTYFVPRLALKVVQIPSNLSYGYLTDFVQPLALSVAQNLPLHQLWCSDKTPQYISYGVLTKWLTFLNAVTKILETQYKNSSVFGKVATWYRIPKLQFYTNSIENHDYNSIPTETTKGVYWLAVPVEIITRLYLVYRGQNDSW